MLAATLTSFLPNLRICFIVCWLQIVLRMTNLGKIHRVVYTAYPDGGGGKLNCYIKLNGATSITTNQELGFSIQSTPSGIIRCALILSHIVVVPSDTH